MKCNHFINRRLNIVQLSIHYAFCLPLSKPLYKSKCPTLLTFPEIIDLTKIPQIKQSENIYNP